MTQFRVGDKVRIVDSRCYHTNLKILEGKILEVARIDFDGMIKFKGQESILWLLASRFVLAGRRDCPLSDILNWGDKNE